MKLIVGLGNPGKEYENTRHNVGFMTIDKVCNGDNFSKKFNGLYLDKNISGEKVIFLKPLSFMNLSGIVVRDFMRFFKIDSKDILIIRDDLDLPVGTAKIKYNSSSGGDNGIKSIIKEIGTQEFTQIKIGISNDKQRDIVDYVLGKFTKNELNSINKIIDMMPDVIEYYIKNGTEKTMSYYNGKLK